MSCLWKGKGNLSLSQIRSLFISFIRIYKEEYESIWKDQRRHSFPLLLGRESNTLQRKFSKGNSQLSFGFKISISHSLFKVSPFTLSLSLFIFYGLLRIIVIHCYPIAVHFFIQHICLNHSNDFR